MADDSAHELALACTLKPEAQRRVRTRVDKEKREKRRERREERESA